jgi:hypothetical protein
MYSKGCLECKKLLESYESATMAWFRAEGKLRIALHNSDEKSSKRLALELNSMGEHRDTLREAIGRHRSEHVVRAVSTGIGG